MNLVAFHSSKTINENEYRIEIYDLEPWSGVPVEFDVTEKLLDISYNSKTKSDLFAGIIPTNLSFTMFATGGILINFLNPLGTSYEGRFIVVVRRKVPGALGYTKEWHGVVLTDSAKIADTSMSTTELKFPVEIKAVDGLIMLKSKPFLPSSLIDINTIYNKESFRNIIYYLTRALQEVTTSSHVFSASEFFLKTVSHWECEQDPNTTTPATHSILDFSHIKVAVFYKERTADDAAGFMSCYDVINEICKVYGARFYLHDGVWYFEQIGARMVETLAQNNYSRTEKVISTVANYDTLVDKVQSAVRAGGIWEFLPAVKKTTVTLQSEFSGVILTEDTTPQTPLFIYNRVPEPEPDQKLFIYGRIICNNGEPATLDDFEVYRVIFRMQLKVGDWYLSRPVNYSANTNDIFYENPEWSLSPSYVYIATELNLISSSTNTVTDFHLIPPLEVGNDLIHGVLEYSVSVSQIALLNGGNMGSNELPNIDWTVEQTIETYIHGADNDTNLTSIDFTNVNDLFCTKEVKVPTIFGDGFFNYSPTRIMAGLTVTGLERTTGWRFDGSMPYYFISRVLGLEIMKHKKTARLIYRGTIANLTGVAVRFNRRFAYDGHIYLASSGKFNAKMEEFTGNFIEIKGDDITPVIIEEELPQHESESNDLFGLVSSGSNGGAVVANGVLATTITQVQTGTGRGINVTALPISSVPAGTLNAGDTFLMVSPRSGQTQEFVIAQDVQENDTEVQVLPQTTNFSFPTGSYISTQLTNSSAGNGGFKFFEKFPDFQGNVIPVTVKTLPTSNVDLRLFVIAGGRFLTYERDYTLQVSLTENNILLDVRRMGEDVLVLLI